jgi:hypothetical protein
MIDQAASAGPRADRCIDDRLEVFCLPSGTRSTDTTEWLVTGLVAALPGLKLRELFELRRDMLLDADFLVAAVDRSRDQIVGLLTSRLVELPPEREFLHIMVQFVGDGYRQGRVFRRSWASHFTRLLAERGRFPEIIVLKTYNPVAYCAMRAFSRHPEIGFYPADAGLRALAAEIAGTVSPDHPFDPETGVISGVGVPVDLYTERPLSSVPEANDYFARHLRPGDRALCVLHVPTPAGQHAILSALGVAEYDFLAGSTASGA